MTLVSLLLSLESCSRAADGGRDEYESFVSELIPVLSFFNGLTVVLRRDEGCERSIAQLSSRSGSIFTEIVSWGETHASTAFTHGLSNIRSVCSEEKEGGVLFLTLSLCFLLKIFLSLLHMDILYVP